MEWLGTIGKWALVVFAVTNVAMAVYENRRKSSFIWSIWKRIRPLMVIECVLLVIAIIAFAITASEYIPFLGWGWTNIFFKGGGNILLAPVIEIQNSTPVTATAIHTISMKQCLVLAFLLLFILAAPFLTKSEEDSFRKGHWRWQEISKKSVIFGLIHLTVGIPLSSAFALIGAGFFLGWKYRRAYIKLTKQGMDWWQAEEEAVLVSTTYHTVYNTLIVALLAFIIFNK